MSAQMSVPFMDLDSIVWCIRL